MTKIQNELHSWQLVKQELTIAATIGEVTDVKLRILYESDLQQTPAQLEFAYRIDGQQFVRTVRSIPEVTNGIITQPA